MAPARRARSPDDSHLYADDTDQESDHETPKSRKNGLKKRLSEAYNPENDGSFVSDSGRVPLRSVNINDDAAEKRRRRKSTKLPQVESIIADSQQDPSGEHDAGESSRAAKQKQPLKSIVPAPAINVPKDIMSSNYEEWMKLATDNKINAANSWDFALIDYFHDMSLLRNNDDNSINFQRASCTLDGCVKIWTSRVDSVGTDTGKLLSNLASDGRDGEEEDEEGGEGEEGRKKKTHRPAATLAKDPAQLRSKKLELEFSVDPLFRKTCADFDEGGAQGLLMNHLSLGVESDGGMRVVFDASDSTGKVEEEEFVEEPEDEVDLSYLRRTFLPNLDVLENKAISHSLVDFSFAKDTFSFEETYVQDSVLQDDDDDDDVADIGPGMDLGGFDIDSGENGPQEEDFFNGGDAGNDDFGGDNFGGEDYGADGHSNGSVGAADDDNANSGPFVPFDPRRAPNDKDLVMAMREDGGGDGMMDYFDQNFFKNWAGPEHWKLRRPIRRADAEGGDKKPKARKEKKEAFKIDFLSPIDTSKTLKELSEEIFAPVTKGAGINLPGTGAGTKKGRKRTKEKERDDHRLPDDMHFSSKQLVTLFLKPRFYLKMRGKQVKLNEGDGEVDEEFWARATRQADDNNMDQDDDGGDQLPFTHFNHDDFDDGPGFDDVDPYDGDFTRTGDPDAEEDLLAATAGQTRKVRPQYVNYAKRAKRVDVRKLKDNIWKGLDIVVAEKGEDGMDIDSDGAAPTDPDEARSFGQVINGLQRSYPKDKMAEISTSFCFICLLHLANEQGLKLEAPSDEDNVMQQTEEDDSNDAKIRDIWDLKIYRDPEAGQSA